MDNEQIKHIIKRVQNGDSDAFAHLIHTYKEYVYALCFKLCQSQEDAEEVAQDTFVKAYKSIKTFKGKAKFSTWLYRIAYFTSLNHLRKNKLKTTNEFAYEPSDASNSGLDKIRESERSYYLNKALEHLKPTERAVIVLFYLEDHSIEEIAAITKLSTSNTKVKLHRTKKKLYGILNALLKNEVNSLV